MTTLTYPSTKGYRTLRLPLARYEYDDFVSDNAFTKERLKELYGHYPDLFPEGFEHGYVLYGYTPASSKLDLCCRRLRLATHDVVYTVAPGFVMPYRSGDVDDVSNALFLMRFNVPCWAIAHVFGHDAMSWYRLEQGLGRFSVVGTTVRSPEHLPRDLVADEKHSWRKGERVYVATTASEGCLLGASVASSASQPDLKAAYGVFAHEARDVDPDYGPDTVNTDGWKATKAMGTTFVEAADKIWHPYGAPSKRAFAQRLRRLRDWAKEALPTSAMQDHVLDVCDKRDQCSVSYDHEQTYRTSNLVDRLMSYIDRAFFNSQLGRSSPWYSFRCFTPPCTSCTHRHKRDGRGGCPPQQYRCHSFCGPQVL